MTVRELIHKLMECNLDAEVEVQIPTKQVDKECKCNQFDVVRVFGPRNEKHALIDCEDLYFGTYED